MAPPRRRARRGGGAAVAGVAMIAAVLLALAGGAYVRFVLIDDTPVDAATLCPVTGPKAHLTILIDTTDPVTPAQLAAARTLIEREIDGAAEDTLISLARVSPDAVARGEVRGGVCKPREGAAASQFYENPGLVARIYDERFRRPLDADLDAMLSGGEEPNSPIMESIQLLVAGASGFLTFDGPRKIVVFSDLLQHSDAMSFYRRMGWREFEMAGGTARLSRNLAGVEVLLLRVPRSQASAAQIDDFWARYFDVQGAGPIRVQTLGEF